jgi:hypothetical protein
MRCQDLPDDQPIDGDVGDFDDFAEVFGVASGAASSGLGAADRVDGAGVVEAPGSVAHVPSPARDDVGLPGVDANLHAVGDDVGSAHGSVAGRVLGQVGKADVTVDIPGFGKISFYQRYQRFQATCCAVEHGASCKLTRTQNRSIAKPAQGRPLGLMVSWLRELGPLVDCKADHRSELLMTGLDRATRRGHRHFLRTLPNGVELESREIRHPGEDSEPEDMP